jgi:protein TonB
LPLAADAWDRGELSSAARQRQPRPNWAASGASVLLHVGVLMLILAMSLTRGPAVAPGDAIPVTLTFEAPAPAAPEPTAPAAEPVLPPPDAVRAEPPATAPDKSAVAATPETAEKVQTPPEPPPPLVVPEPVASAPPAAEALPLPPPAPAEPLATATTPDPPRQPPSAAASPKAAPAPPPPPQPRRQVRRATAPRAAVAPPPPPPGPQAALPSPTARPAAPEQLAALPFIPPRPVGARAGNRKPDYPMEARRRRQQGRVLLRVSVSPTGQAAAVHIVSSSGHPLLDQAAHMAVSSWRFIPATRAGLAVAGQADVPIEFRMDD